MSGRHRGLGGIFQHARGDGAEPRSSLQTLPGTRDSPGPQSDRSPAPSHNNTCPCLFLYCIGHLGDRRFAWLVFGKRVILRNECLPRTPSGWSTRPPPRLRKISTTRSCSAICLGPGAASHGRFGGGPWFGPKLKTYVCNRFEKLGVWKQSGRICLGQRSGLIICMPG